MVDITIVNGVYKPTYNWGAPSCGIHIHFQSLRCCEVRRKLRLLRIWSWRTECLSSQTSRRLRKFDRLAMSWPSDVFHGMATSGTKSPRASRRAAHLRRAVDLLHLTTERWSRSLKWAETRKDECSQGWEDLLTGWERPENQISLETKIWNHALEEFNISLTIPKSQKLSQHNYGLHWNENLSNQNQADPNFMP